MVVINIGRGKALCVCELLVHKAEHVVRGTLKTRVRSGFGRNGCIELTCSGCPSCVRGLKRRLVIYKDALGASQACRYDLSYAERKRLCITKNVRF